MTSRTDILIELDELIAQKRTELGHLERAREVIATALDGYVIAGPALRACDAPTREAERPAAPPVRDSVSPHGRRYDDDYKRRILSEIDAGPRGTRAMVERREGIGYGTIASWRKQFASSKRESAPEEERSPRRNLIAARAKKRKQKR